LKIWKTAKKIDGSLLRVQEVLFSPTYFKKASAEEKLRLFNSLLKGYQEEIDNLTKRAKFGENTFLNIYQKLYEAPDPYPGLASITEVVSEGMKKELQTRPTEKLVEGLRKKVKILQVKLSEKISLLETDDGKIRELTEKVNEQQKLIQKLEDDTLKGYSSKEWKGTLFDDWDISESTGNELSEEIRQLKEKIRAQTADLEKTKTDNVKLYGKIPGL
ncbi:hypothetical protein ES319_D12G294300v1, partial [Gossypium barbadense]